VARGTLAEFLDRTRARVDQALENWLSKPPDCPAIVSEAMRYSVFAGGKRLRPLLALAAADAVDPAALDRALPAACAIELIHTYSLIHDDLPAMDNDTLRRGRPTLHVVYGDGVAILAGDGLHAEAFSLLAREPQTPAIDLQAGGQAPGRRLTLDAQGVQSMHARKTGALIRASALAGAIMAGAPDELAGLIDRYAADVGLAFQIVDDILDVEGDPAALGKSAGKDAAGDKPTYPRLFGLDESRRLAADCLARAHATLREASLVGTHLPGIADWVIRRRN